MIRSIGHPATLGFIVLLLFLNPATATMLPLSTGTLVESSDVIIIGQAVDSRSYWAENETVILTATTISVNSILKGDAPDTITIITRGGVAGDVCMWVEDEPVFFPGFTYGMFLNHQGGDTFSVQGNYQGVYLVCGEPATDSGDRGLPCMSPGDFALRVSGVPGRNLPGLVEEGTVAIEDPHGIPASPADVPVIYSITPESAPAGTGSAVIIHGQGFGTKSSRNSSADVMFTFDETFPIWASGRCELFPEWETANENAILEWTDTRIVVNVPVGWVNIGSSRYPGGASSGPVSVITDEGVQSNEVPFSVNFSYSTAKWEYPEVLFVIVSDDESVVAPIMAAAETWSSVPGSRFELVFAAYEQGGESQPSMNGRNEIFWGTTSSPDTIAETTRWISSQEVYPRGFNLETDIVFNRDINWSAGDPGQDQYDIETFALHEFGHWAGLSDLYGDIPGYPSDVHKVMYGWGSPGTVKRTLALEDMAGIRYIYPVAIPPVVTVLPTPPVTPAETEVPTMHPTPPGTEQPMDTPTDTPTVSPPDTPTQSPAISPAPTATPIPLVTGTPTVTPAETILPPPTPTPAVTAIPTDTPAATPTPSPTPTSPSIPDPYLDMISLRSGWNFISIPGPLADGMNTAGVVFAGVDTSGKSVYLYDAETGTWEVMTAESIVMPHKGIWIYSVHAIDVPLVFRG